MSDRNPNPCQAVMLRTGICGRKAMDWRMAMVRTESPSSTHEDEVAYAVGWTISGLATLGTIIAVWLFAI